MIVDDSWVDHQLSCTIIDYHQLSFSLSLLKFFMIVDDGFSRLTTHMIVHDSSSVSCFGNAPINVKPLGGGEAGHRWGI